MSYKLYRCLESFALRPGGAEKELEGVGRIMTRIGNIVMYLYHKDEWEYFLVEDKIFSRVRVFEEWLEKLC